MASSTHNGTLRGSLLRMLLNLWCSESFPTARASSSSKNDTSLISVQSASLDIPACPIHWESKQSIRKRPEVCRGCAELKPGTNHPCQTHQPRPQTEEPPQRCPDCVSICCLRPIYLILSEARSFPKHSVLNCSPPSKTYSTLQQSHNVCIYLCNI